MTRAVAGTTTTASADCPIRMWGMGSSSWNSNVWPRSDARAENVVSPTKRIAPRVNTGTTWAPRSPCRPRCRPTPRGRCVVLRARRGLGLPGPGLLDLTGGRFSTLGTGLGLGGFLLARVDEHDLVAGDLLERDRQRLAGNGRDLGRHDGPQTFAQLVEVGVDLPGAHRAQRDQRELRPGTVEQLLDGGVHHRVLA